MTSDPRCRRFLDLEGAGDERVDEALFALFRALPVLAPGVDFAERVLERSGARWWSHWGIRAAVVLVAIQSGLVLAASGSVAAPFLVDLGFAGTMSLLGRGMVGVLQGVAAALPGVLHTVDWLRAITQGVVTPGLLTGVAFCLAASTIGLFVLSRLLEDERWHVPDDGRVGAA